MQALDVVVFGHAGRYSASLSAPLQTIDSARRAMLVVFDGTPASHRALNAALDLVRDTRSRWGSCSSTSRLSFSWRLVLAPEPVIDYVVAHEVAHLQEMNHSPRFWQLVARLVPDLGPPRAWLKTNGAQLLRYG